MTDELDVLPVPSAAEARNPADRIQLFDTTLRDGEQSPGIALSATDKVAIAHQLARLGVDVIEAGFPIASDGDFAAVSRVAAEVRGPTICALARTQAADIARAGDSLRAAERSRIHTFIATSDIHLKYKLEMSRAEVLAQTRAAVEHAAGLAHEVQFSAEDASRSDLDYLAEVFAVAIDAGATIINVPDTVGYALPDSFARLIADLFDVLPALHDVTVAVHCHDDLGLAVANSLAGLNAGARQFEGAVNGIGERAGNASLEEIIMLAATHHPGGLWTSANSKEIMRTSTLVSRLTGYLVQPNKAIVGRNAFAHEAGIHQDGVLKERTTYEIMLPEDVGLASNKLVLGKHSGRHALAAALADMGLDDGVDLGAVFKRFKKLADRKGEVFAADLIALVNDTVPADSTDAGPYELAHFKVTARDDGPPEAQVTVVVNGVPTRGEATGDGPVDALCWALNEATGVQDARMAEYRVQAVTPETDALGEVTILVHIGERAASGRAASTDIIEASAVAYLRALATLA